MHTQFASILTHRVQIQLSRLSLLFTLLISSISTFANEVHFRGRVTDKNHVGLSQAVIELEDKKGLIYCNKEGRFNVKVDIDTIDAFKISCPGYDSREIEVGDVNDDSIVIVLQKTVISLNSAKVSAKGGNLQEGTTGVDGGSTDYGCYLKYKDELAIYLPCDTSLHATLKDINVYIKKEGGHDNKFTLHIFDKDSTGAPGEELATDTVMYVGAKKGGEWVSVDLSDKLIQMKSGLFVSMEWTLNLGKAYFLSEMDPKTNFYSGEDSFKNKYNGPVVGMAYGGETQPVVYRRYAENIYNHVDEGKWYKTAPRSGARHNKKWITPMIFCRYNYFEKK